LEVIVVNLGKVPRFIQSMDVAIDLP
jgi:hypothetical protein